VCIYVQQAFYNLPPAAATASKTVSLNVMEEHPSDVPKSIGLHHSALQTATSVYMRLFMCVGETNTKKKKS
jgi:hypothetical protein